MEVSGGNGHIHQSPAPLARFFHGTSSVAPKPSRFPNEVDIRTVDGIRKQFANELMV